MRFSLYCDLSAYIIAYYMQIVNSLLKKTAVNGKFLGISLGNSLDFLPTSVYNIDYKV